MLSAHAATHLGAGIVIAALPGDAAPHASGTEVVTRTLPADAAGGITPAAVAELAPDLDRFGAVVLGPGIGRGDDVATTVAALARVVPCPLVLDADALVALGHRARAGPRSHRGRRSSPRTTASSSDSPAAGRAPTGSPPPGRSRPGPARWCCSRDRRPWSPRPDGRVLVNPTGTPDLATAGSGDVLSGMIAAFCARGVEPVEAAAAAAFVHGLAAESAGHTGFVATDLPGLAARALRRIPAP